MQEIYAYMTNFTKGWLKYENSYEDLTKADFYINFRFYRESRVTDGLTKTEIWSMSRVTMGLPAYFVTDVCSR